MIADSYIPQDFRSRSRIKMIANRWSITTTVVLPDDIALSQRAVVTDDGGRANHITMRMIDDQPFTDDGAGGNLRPGED